MVSPIMSVNITGLIGITEWLTGGTSIISDEADSWIVGTNVEYSIYVEFGTCKMRAQPYLFPAAEQVINKSDVYWVQSKDVNEFIRKLAMEIEGIAKHYCPVDTGHLMNSIEAEKL